MKALVMAAGALLLAANQIGFEPESRVWIEGDSTVRGFTCEAKKLGAAVHVEADRPLAALVTGAKVTIPVAALDCGNGTMNDHMRKALLQPKHGDIVFTLASYRLTGTDAVLKGGLLMAGTTREISIPATVTSDGDVVRVKATTKLDMTQWGVKPPSLMMGTMKVKNDVMVRFDVALKP